MHRIDSATVEADKFGAGKDGFTAGTPPSTPPTELTAEWHDEVQEEIAGVIEGTGGALSKGTATQLLSAIRKQLAYDATAEWTTRTPAAATDFRACARSATLWCAVGASAKIETSPEGVVWTARTKDGAFAGVFYGLAHDGVGLWCAVGASGEIQTSADGTTWTHRSADASYSGTFWAVAHYGSLWVTVGSGGEIQTSADGTTWTRRTPGASYTNDFRHVIYDTVNGLWVVVGDAGEIQTSANGTTGWTHQTSGTANDLYGVACYAGKIIACGGVYTIATSTNGTTWSVAAGPVAAFYDAIGVDNAGVWCIVGQVGTILVSFDGITWVQRVQQAYASYLYAVAHDGVGLWLAVGGSSGGLLTSRRR